MADINIHWKKITRGLPKGKSYADDRIPTDEVIQKLLEYPDRRIKAIGILAYQQLFQQEIQSMQLH